MADKKVVETVYGKHHKYEIVKEEHLISDSTYYVYKDGKPHRGSFSSLSKAVEAAKSEG
jgi:hypothetical protein